MLAPSYLITDSASLRDEALFLLLLETCPTFGHSFCFFHKSHKPLLHLLPPSCFAVCVHNPSPSMTVVFSVLSYVPNDFMPQSFSSHIYPSNTSRSSLRSSDSSTNKSYSLMLRHWGALLCIYLLPYPSTVLPLPSFLQVQVPHPKYSFKSFA